jgi:hypothetical protein
MVMVVVISGLAAVLLFSQGRSGTPATEDRRTARAWVDLAAIGAGEVRAEDRWGSVETFAGAATGTLSYYNQVSFLQTSAAECVVLGGEVWCMMRSSSTGTVLLRYTPAVQGQGWNISFECYAPQAGDALDLDRGRQQIGLTATLIDRQGVALAAVDLSYGTPGDNYVRLRDISAANTTYFSESMLPSATVRGGLEGFAPERYLTSFRGAGGGCEVTVLHSGALVGRGAVSVPSSWTGPAQLVLSTSSTVLVVPDPSVPGAVITYSGAWVVDNLACRGATAPYPLAGPQYEYAAEGAGVPSYAPAGVPREGAEVTIGGVSTSFNTTTGRYEADLRMSVGWGRSVTYTAVLDGVTVTDTMSLTMMTNATNAFVSQWWNGWDWVSVFGLDDCAGPDSALAVYQEYDHPITAYIMYPGGSSGQTLDYPYLEIGLHAPHDWEGGSKKFWNDAVDQAQQGAQTLRDNYSYASRWDSPSNGGRGDTFISMANPGNKATYQQLYALYQAGIRIDGRSSDKAAGSPGNHTQLGSWYDPGGYGGSGAGWYPYREIDLMDAARLLSWDGAQSWSAAFGLVNSVAQNHGVLRAYGHPNRAIAVPQLMHWIDDPKTNYSLENWKATDGEVASYIYGRWSTDLGFDRGRSDSTTWVYNVSRADAAGAGYWNVPITIGIDLHGRTVKEVVVHDGGRTLRMSSGSLDDLHGARIMDSGYDIRNGVLYVSSQWSAGSTITVTFETSGALDLAPAAPMVMRSEDR